MKFPFTEIERVQAEQTGKREGDREATFGSEYCE